MLGSARAVLLSLALAAFSATAVAQPRPTGPRIAVLLDATTLWRDRAAPGISDGAHEALLNALTGLLRRLAPNKACVVVFNQEKDRVLYRNDSFERSALEELSRSIEDLKLGEIDAHGNTDKDRGARLLERLLDEILDAGEPFDAIVFLGSAERFLGRARPPHPKNASRPLFFSLQLVGSFVILVNAHPTPLSSATSHDTVSKLVHDLGGKLLQVYSPDGFDKAVDRIARDLARRRQCLAIPSCRIVGMPGIGALTFLASTLLGGTPVAPESIPAPLLRLLDEGTSGTLTCTVKPKKPTLDFAFRIGAGYSVEIPIAQLQGTTPHWETLLRLEQGADTPLYFRARRDLPMVPLSATGELSFDDTFPLAPGNARARWVLVDNEGRVCRKSWDLHAATQPAPSTRNGEPKDGPRVSLLLDATTLWVDPGGARIADAQRETMVAALAGLLTRLAPRHARLVVFNQEKDITLFRRDPFEPSAVPEVSKALSDLKLSEIEVHALAEKDRGGHLVERLVEQELHSSEPAEAVIFLGPAERYLGHARPRVEKTDSAALFFDIQFVASQVVMETAAGNPDYSYRAESGDFGGRRDGTAAHRVIRSSASSFDTVATVVRDLGGTLIQIYTPDQFAKSLDRIGAAIRKAR